MALLFFSFIFSIFATAASFGSTKYLLSSRRYNQNRICDKNVGPCSRLKIGENVEFDPTGNTDPDYQQFLSGPEGKPWKGTRIALVRKGQVPLPEYSAQDVVRICLAALLNNDDPQLDHGACVVLEFKSPTGPLAEGGLDPAAYGRFLRSSDYNCLIDFKSSELVGELEQLSDSLSVRQQVKITDWQNSMNNRGVNIFDFYLTQVRGCWLLDIILLRK